MVVLEDPREDYPEEYEGNLSSEAFDLNPSEYYDDLSQAGKQ